MSQVDTQPQTDTPVIFVSYNRRAKAYQWVEPESGETFEFPSGPAGKFEAFRFAVSMLEPELYAAATGIIEKHPQLERVTWKAVEIVTKNGVEVLLADRVMAMVDSSDGMGRYAITSDGGYTACQCENFTSFSAPMTEGGNSYCKHIVAYHLWLMVREDRI